MTEDRQLLQVDGTRQPSKALHNPNFKHRLPCGYLAATLRLPCGHIQNTENLMEVNPDRKHGVKPLRRLTVNSDNFPTTPAGKPLLKYSILYSIRPSLGSLRPPITIAQAYVLERSLQFYTKKLDFD